VSPVKRLEQWIKNDGVHKKQSGEYISVEQSGSGDWRKIEA